MNIFKNISNGYKKIATGIAIVSFLAVIYIALIPGGTLAAVYGANGVGIGSAIVKIVEWPQYNATTAPDGTYTISSVPYNDTPEGSTYTLRASAAGYGSNSSKVTLTPGNPNPAVDWTLYTSVPYYIPYLDDRGTSYESEIQVLNPFTFDDTVDLRAYNVLNSLITTKAYEIPVNGQNSTIVEHVAGGDFVGTVMVENTKPLSLVQGFIKTLSIGTYSIAPSRKIPAATIQYIPYLDDRGTTFDSGIQIFNPYDVSITATLTAYNVLTGLNNSLIFDIPAKSFGSRYAGDVAGGAVGSNVDFVGTVKVETTQPALVQGNIRSRSQMVTSIAPSVIVPAVNVQYIPYLDDRGTTYDSGVQIFNPYDVSITATLTAYNVLTGLNNTLIFDIPAKSFGSRYAGDVAGGAVGSNVDFVGTVKVETTQPALVQGNIRSRSLMITSIAPASLVPVVTDQYILFLKDVGTTYDSGIQIFNPYDVTITADLTGKNVLNGQTTTLSFDIPAKSFGSRYAGDVAGGAVGSNVDFQGSVKVVTTQPALVQGNIRERTNMITSVAPAAVLE